MLVNDLLLDKFGHKMHKSRGNAINPFELMEKYGADPIRFYMLYASPVWTPLKFDEDGVKEVQSKFFNTLKNTYTFFQMYANTDEVDPRSYHVDYKDLEEIDKWLLSKYHKLVKFVTESMDEYDLNKAVRAINNFVNEDLSNWYIRRNRRRFWESELTVSKKAVYETTYEVLLGICKLAAPFIPFATEEIFRALTNKESVHLEDYPVYEESMIDEKIEKRMDLVRDLISLGRYVREEAKVKVRQPISEALIDGKNKDLISDLTLLIKEELNVKEVIFTDELNHYMNYIVKPNFKIVGKILGPKVGEFGTVLSSLSVEEVNKLQNNENVMITLSGETFEVTSEMVDIRIESKEGFNVGMLNNNFIILNTELNEALIEEGIARELVSKIQQLRKSNDFEITDRIDVYYKADEEVEKAIMNNLEYMKEETLALSITSKEDLKENFDINGHDVYLEVIKK